MTLKRKFKQNDCRLCKKTFCCIDCRKKHEHSSHNIYPDCDICLYGRIVLKSPTEALLIHIKAAHWPLHCVFCKRCFGSEEELINHNKCPVGPPHKSMDLSFQVLPKNVENKCELDELTESPIFYENYKKQEHAKMLICPVVPFQKNNNENSNGICIMSKTPLRLLKDGVQTNDFISPSATTSFTANLNLKKPTSSTPVIQKDEENNLENIVPNTITPVDIDSSNEGIINKKLKDGSKRRVTFGESSTDSAKKKNYTKTPFKKMELNKISLKDLPGFNLTHDTECDENNYYTARSENLDIECLAERKESNKKRRSSTFSESTLWQTAINDSIELLEPPRKKFVTDNENPDVNIVNIGNENGELNAPPLMTDDFQFWDNSRSFKDSEPIKQDKACGSFIWNSNSCQSINQKSLWSSMTNIVKSAVQVLSVQPKFEQPTALHSNNKRQIFNVEDSQETDHHFKKFKFSDIRCRPTIRCLEPHIYYKRHYKPFVFKVDKATQTDFLDFQN